MHGACCSISYALSPSLFSIRREDAALREAGSGGALRAAGLPSAGSSFFLMETRFAAGLQAPVLQAGRGGSEGGRTAPQAPPGTWQGHGEVSVPTRKALCPSLHTSSPPAVGGLPLSHFAPLSLTPGPWGLRSQLPMGLSTTQGLYAPAGVSCSE